MAASAPPPHLGSGWGDRKSSEDDARTNALELKMSGMSLMSSFANSNSGGAPGLSCSTVSTASADDVGNLRNHPHDSSIDHSVAGSFKAGSVPSSPSPEAAGYAFSRPPGLSGPSMPSPLSGGPGHSKTSSATSQMLTLTPNSSVDGNSDMYSLGRQQSPFTGSDTGPSMPFLRNDVRHSVDGRGGISDFGSFDLGENDNDGLLGLDALRDRAYSSPGPMARSFESAPSLRGEHFPPPQRVAIHHELPPDGRRHRGVSRDNSGRSSSSARPPLSGGNAVQSPRSLDPTPSHVAGDLSLGGLVVPFPGGGGRSGDPSPVRSTQYQDSDLRGFGTIGRPEFSGSAPEWEPHQSRRSSFAGTEPSALPRTEYRHERELPYAYEPSRRRSIGTESGREFHEHYGGSQYSGEHGGHGDYGHPQMEQQKIGLPAMPTGHVQRMSSHGTTGSHGPPPQYNQGMLPPGRHQRSMSGPGPRGPPEQLGVDGGRYPPEDIGHFASRDASRYLGAGPLSQSTHHSRSLSGDGSYRLAGGNARRSASMSLGTAGMSSSYEGPGMPSQKRMSQPNLGSGGFYQSGHQGSLPSLQASMQRMEQSGDYGHHQYEDDLLGEHIEVPADHVEGYPRHPSLSYGESMRSHEMGPHYGHLPTAGAALPSPKVVIAVKFKRTQRNFVLGPRINRDLKVGTYVKVEADRGEDLGIVIGKVPAEKYAFSSRTAARSYDMMPPPAGLGPPGASDLKCIIRLATHDEVSLLALKREEEEELLKICRTKVRQRALPMNVVDAEYQFDRHKLTFFFEAEGRVDFRELVRDLFSMYKTRIWMQQLDKNVGPVGVLSGSISPPPSSMIDYGTPIIAPASEFSDALNGMGRCGYGSS